MLRYEMMLHAIRFEPRSKKRWAVVLPLGVLEYPRRAFAGRHMDTLAVHRDPRDPGKKEMDLVILPPFYYGGRELRGRAAGRENGIATGQRRGSGAFPPKGDVSGPAAHRLRNIHVLIHHQTERTSSPHADRPRVQIRGPVRRSSPSSRKDRREGGMVGDRTRWLTITRGNRPARIRFNWIKTHPLMTAEAMEGYPFDHAGQGENLADDGAVSRRGGPLQVVRRKVVRSIGQGRVCRIRRPRTGPAYSRICASRSASFAPVAGFIPGMPRLC